MSQLLKPITKKVLYINLSCDLVSSRIKERIRELGFSSSSALRHQT